MWSWHGLFEDEMQETRTVKPAVTGGRKVVVRYQQVRQTRSVA